MPDREGWAGSFCGVSGGALLVVGGANFPDRKPWEGGAKVWSDAVFVLENPDGAWRLVGHLPKPLGYGVSVTADDALWCFGGSNQSGHFAEGFRVRWRAGHLQIERAPALPRSCANMSGALAGRTVYVTGGIERSDSTECLSVFWSLDLDHLERGWRGLPSCPGSRRMLAVSASVEGDFYLMSGAGLHRGPNGEPVRDYLRDAWRYRPDVGWQRLADLPRPAVAAGILTRRETKAGRLLLVSGDDGAVPGNRGLAAHPGFPRESIEYDVAAERWMHRSLIPISRATFTAGWWREQWWMPGGEVRPGVRTTEVWRLNWGGAGEN